jgi:3-hydroxyisobutyrate dehydrogenase-like beta-hydroxyacid dehydrogenase
MKLGFIGLGAMGLPVVGSLLKAGHEVAAYNRTRSRTRDGELRSRGAHVAESVAEACRADVVLTMLADDAAVEAVVFGEGGVLAALARGAVHVSLSTIGTAMARRLADAHAGAGQHFVAAPVFGRPDAAAAQKLVVVAAGPAAAIERAREPLESIGRKLYVLGDDPVAAATLKLGGNFLIVAMIETLGEAYALLRKSGVEPARFLEIVGGDLFQSPLYQTYGRMIAEERYEPAGFKLRLGLKDVRLALAAADARGVPMPFASVLADHLRAAVANGMGDLDWSALARSAAERAGL